MQHGLEVAGSALGCFVREELPPGAAAVYDCGDDLPFVRHLDGPGGEPVWRLGGGTVTVPLLGLAPGLMERSCRRLLELQAGARAPVALEAAWALFGGLDLSWRVLDAGRCLLGVPSPEFLGVVPSRGGAWNALLLSPHVVRLLPGPSHVLLPGGGKLGPL